MRKEGLRGRTSLLYNNDHKMEWEASLQREHQRLIVVLVIEHLVHGVGAEHQEGNVNVPPDLEDIRVKISS